MLTPEFPENLENHHIELTSAATNQIALMLEHDWTLTDKVLRLHIKGKGCDGFTYSLGFDDEQKNDLSMELDTIECKLNMDPFTAAYCKRVTIDHFHDPETLQDGLTITNHDQSNYEGKFFKD